MNIKNVSSKIKKLLTHKTIVIVGIDGRSGSGKSSYAKRLKQLLPDSVIIHLDDYDLYQGEQKIQRVIDEVLKPILNQGLNKIVILEGVFSLSSRLIPYYNYKIWIDCPVEVGLKRGLQRDIKLNGIDNSEKWLNYWLPKEEEYISNEKPQLKADVVIDS